MLFMLLVYLMTTIFFINFSPSILFWIWLEFNTILFVALISDSGSSMNKLEISSQSFYYFLIQSCASVFFLFYLYVDFLFLGNYFLMLVMSFKIGMFPFHFWVYKISYYLNSMSLFLLLNIQKFSIILFMVTFNFEFILLFLILNMVFGSLFLYKSKEFISLLVSSSIAFLSWFVFFSFWSFLGSLIFFMKYLLLNSFMLKLKSFFSLQSYNLSMMSKNILLLLFLSGLPPMSFFFFKYYLLNNFILNTSFMLSILIWMFSFLCMICYFNFFFFSFYMEKGFYPSSIKMDLSYPLLLGSIGLFQTMFY